MALINSNTNTCNSWNKNRFFATVKLINYYTTTNKIPYPFLVPFSSVILHSSEVNLRLAMICSPPEVRSTRD